MFTRRHIMTERGGALAIEGAVSFLFFLLPRAQQRSTVSHKRIPAGEGGVAFKPCGNLISIERPGVRATEDGLHRGRIMRRESWMYDAGIMTSTEQWPLGLFGAVAGFLVPSSSRVDERTTDHIQHHLCDRASHGERKFLRLGARKQRSNTKNDAKPS